MKLQRTTGTLGLAVLVAFATTAAMAADSGWYGGLSIGASKAEIEDERIRNGLLPRIVTSIEDDDSDLGFKLLAGRKFNRNFAVEAGYFNLGKSIGDRGIFTVFWTDGKRYRAILSRDMTPEENTFYERKNSELGY